MRSKPLKPANPTAKNGIGGGWKAPKYKRTYFEEPTIDPKTIGYPKTQSEIHTFATKQLQRAQQTMSAKGNGKLTQSEVDAIMKARAKRERRAARQAQDMQRGQAN